jgi:predicted nucleotidyltransferase
MKNILKQVYGVELASQKVELAESTKVNGIIKKYNSIKNTERGFYADKFNSIKSEVAKKIDSLGDVIDESKKIIPLLKEIGASKDLKELEATLMNAKEDFDAMVEVLDLVKRF